MCSRPSFKSGYDPWYEHRILYFCGRIQDSGGLVASVGAQESIDMPNIDKIVLFERSQISQPKRSLLTREKYCSAGARLNSKSHRTQPRMFTY